MLTSEQVVEYLIMIDLQRKGTENKLNAGGLSTLFNLQSKKELKDVKIVDVLDYIHAQEEKLAIKDKMVDIACGKLVDFEYEQKESVHSAQVWKEHFEALAKQELAKQELVD